MQFSEDCPDEIKEKFMESVLAFEEVKPVSPFDELVKWRYWFHFLESER